MAIGYMTTGTAANVRAETTGAPAVASTGTVEWIGLVALDNWHFGSFAVYSLGTCRGQWSVQLRGWTTSADGDRFQFNWHDGSSILNMQSNAGLPLWDPFEWKWIRFVFDPDNGSNRTLDCYYSEDPVDTDPASVSWTQVGTQVTSTTTTIRAATVTATGVGGDSLLTGGGPNNSRVAVVSALHNGSEVIDPDFRDGDQGWASPPATDGHANSWSFINGAAWVPNTLDQILGRSVHFDFENKQVVIESGV